MPREIDCPDCGGSGAIPTMPDGEPEMCKLCDTTGKITIYTEEELQEAVKKKQEECALICEEELEFDTGFDVADIIRNIGIKNDSQNT